nr:hypothetical protein [Deltaproteobacteria bacterium]
MEVHCFLSALPPPLQCYRVAFFAVAFFAVAFFAVAFFAVTFFAVAFFAVTFLGPLAFAGAFFTVLVFAGAFFAPLTFAGAVFAPLTFAGTFFTELAFAMTFFAVPTFAVAFFAPLVFVVGFFTSTVFAVAFLVSLVVTSERAVPLLAAFVPVRVAAFLAVWGVALAVVFRVGSAAGGFGSTSARPLVNDASPWRFCNIEGGVSATGPMASASITWSCAAWRARIAPRSGLPGGPPSGAGSSTAGRP